MKATETEVKKAVEVEYEGLLKGTKHPILFLAAVFIIVTVVGIVLS